jgi:hypothetical protein
LPSSDKPERRSRSAFQESNSLFPMSLTGPSACRYPEVGLRFLAFFVWNGGKQSKGENDFVPEGANTLQDRLIDRKTTASRSHSSKLQHRAPQEIPSNLSHVRKTLGSGVSVLPIATSLDDAGQWLLCYAGARLSRVREPHFQNSSGKMKFLRSAQAKINGGVDAVKANTVLFTVIVREVVKKASRFLRKS